MIEFKNVDVIFGKQPDRAISLIEDNVSRGEILKQTGLTVGVRDASLKVNKGEICVLMGLSGSGKSSLLRTANGLNDVTRGEVRIHTDAGMQDFSSLSQEEKRLARMNHITMVFQKFALMPWLTVAQNVGFGLEQKGLSRKEVKEKVRHQLDLVGLTPWANKKPSELSGGMQQRVGLARALSMETDIILMDEPFSALDPLIRAQLQDELLRLQEQLQKTVLFVSHDLDEALKLGNQIAIMKDGEIVQHDKPERIVLNPANDYVRNFVAHINPAEVIRAHSLLRPLEELPEKDGQYCLSKRDDYWLSLEQEVEQTKISHQGKTLDVQRWDGEEAIDKLQKKPTLVSGKTVMKDLMEIRYYTGHGMLIEDDGRILGYVGDKDIYHGMLGKLLED